MDSIDCLDLEDMIEEYKYLKEHGKTNPKAVFLDIPVKEKESECVVNTCRLAISSNRLAFEEYGIKRPIDTIYISDQSEMKIAKEIKKGLKEVVKDSCNEFSNKGIEKMFPNIKYVDLGNDLGNVILEKWSGINELRKLIEHIKKNGLVGKGLNMYLVSLLLSERGYDNPILFSDSDEKFRSARQFLALTLGLSHLNYDAIVGVFDRYHKNYDGDIERGGRVNAGTRALFDIITEAGQMKQIGYPLCGDQGSVLRVLSNLRFPIKFGIETAMRIQYHSHVNGFNPPFFKPLLFNKRSLQVNIRGSDDEPLAEGESYREVKKSVYKMSKEVAEAFFASTSIDFLGRWNSCEDFMKNSFDIMQRRALTRYQRICEEQYDGKLLPISGGMSDEQLKKTTYKAVETIARRFYKKPVKEQNRLKKQFLPSLNELKDLLGERYNMLINDLKNFVYDLNI